MPHSKNEPIKTNSMKLQNTSFAIIALIGTLALSSCSENDDSPTPIDPNPKNELRLSDLRQGQSSYYVRYTQPCADPQSFSYSGDTLRVEVFIEDDSLKFRESYTAGSLTLSETEAIEYPVTDKGDYLLITERFRSQLFFFYGNDTLFLNKPTTAELLQDGCALTYQNGDIFIGEEMGNLPLYEIGDISLHSNKAVSCVPTIMPLDAFLIFDSKELKISSFVMQGWEEPSLNGMVLVGF